MADYGIGGASWVKLEAGKYRLIEDKNKKYNTIVEATISCEDLIVYPVDDEAWSHIAPLRILSFDIECAARPGTFPDPTIDPVIQIANYITIQGEENPQIVNIFVLDTCTPIIGVDVRSYRTEEALLVAWSHFVRRVYSSFIIIVILIQID